MKISFPLFLVVAILAWQCENGRDHIDFYTGQKFKIEYGEIATENTSQIIPQYHLFFNSYKNLQIPLFKFVKHNDYEIFIGMPVSTTITDLFHRIYEEPSNKVLISGKQNDSSYLIKYTRDNHFIVTYLSVLKDNSPICFSVMANDSMLIDEFFNKNVFKNRLYE